MKPIRVLITGGTGLLGKALLETAPAGWEVVATFHQNPPPPEWRHRFLPLELRNPESVDQLFRQVQPNVVIHTASIGSVDETESHTDRVRQVNVLGTASVVQACQRCHAFLIHISSNAVFDGSSPPYSEDSSLHAVNRYGQLKIEAEGVVRQSGIPALVVRPILTYGWPLPGGRDNVVTRWLQRLEGGQSVEVARDVFSMPLYAPSGAETLWVSAGLPLQGTLHLAGADHVSLVSFAREVARVFGYDPGRILSVDSAQLKRAALRPKDTAFTLTRMISELKVAPVGVREGLMRMQRARLPVS